jgi:eukaryotic-like serine/threonine-protein kinase
MTHPGASAGRVQAATISGEETHAYTLQAIPPQPFGKFTMIGRLGHGGMAEVLLAVMGGKGGFRKLTVLKRLHPHLEAEPGFIEMFLDEARLAAQLDHPHCVQTLEVGEEEGQHFLAMEHLDGQGLERLLRSSAQTGHLLPVPVAARIVADALEGLGYAHELTRYDGRPLGIVHRDVSPQNLFVTYSGVVKLLDFGIAKAESNVVETRTGVVKGKYAYIAPEQALAMPVDQRADLWSMGVVLWECLTSRRLFKSVNELATLQETLQGVVRPPSAHNPDVPPALDAIVLRALQRDVDLRYPSARAFREDLEAWLLTLHPTPTRASIAALMHERFEEVQRAHREKLAACLAAVETGSGAVELHGSQAGLRSEPGAFAQHTPSSMRRIATPAPALEVSISAPPAAPVVERHGADAHAEQGRRALAWKLVAVGAVALVAVIVAIVLPGGVGEAGAGSTAMVATSLAEPAPESTAAAPVASPAVAPELATAPATEPTAASEPTAADSSPESATEPASAGGQLAPGRSERRRERGAGGSAGAAPTSASAGAARTASTAAEDGYLSLVTSPWTQVRLGGRDLGTTPLVRVRLPAGRHVLRLVNEDAQVSEVYEVEIRPGEVTTRRLGLR